MESYSLLDIAKSRMIWYTVNYNMKKTSAHAIAGIFQKPVSFPVFQTCRKTAG